MFSGRNVRFVLAAGLHFSLACGEPKGPKARGANAVSNDAGPRSQARATAIKADAPPTAEPVARFIEPRGQAIRHEVSPCSVVTLMAAQGTLSLETSPSRDSATAAVTLSEGDAIEVSGAGSALVVRGTGTAALVEAPLPCACDPSEPKLPRVRVFRNGGGPRLTWAAGAMTAELTTHQGEPERCDQSAAPSGNANSAVYLGHLGGSLPVPEHVHERSWEIVFALEADGIMTIDGKEQPLLPRAIVKVPPNTRHAWAPRAGTRLTAIQSYVPPGPEERFKKLAEKAPPP